MKRNKGAGHEFSLYLDPEIYALSSAIVGKTITLYDTYLYHRIRTVLRLDKAAIFTLFSHSDCARVSLCLFDAAKKQLDLEVLSYNKNNEVKPEITFLLPILKREALEAAVYSLTEIGVTTIQPIMTNKSLRISQQEKMYDRLHRIIIAAAEQSKNYTFPILKLSIGFETMMDNLSSINDQKLFFYPAGVSARDWVRQLSNKSVDHIWCMVGPEGDLDNQEKQSAHTAGFVSAALTKTVLRASQAVALSAGIIRSLA